MTTTLFLNGENTNPNSKWINMVCINNEKFIL